MKREHLWVLVLITCVAVLGGVGHGDEKKSTGGAAPPPPEVQVADVVEKSVPVYREYVATTDGMMNATILAQVQGYLIRQNYQ